ncbi:hypothetical protein GSI_01316 [Ganoderma sinense ZZ0214-1]|uniref:Intradiol ring-cleavage dioxygenases domain-containing protein n=1 Tax=Ganoderma sinense ZZ0214-1 TaxID=1077348 RepID=A0A2G8SV62_9APHY|nr:hypothetical protein GSI_01316 [Ganoderma sinense ZZ0214-1]
MRQVDEGQTVFAGTEMLNGESFSLSYGIKNTTTYPKQLKDTKDEPVKNAMIDAWPANSAGSYYFASWTLHGKTITDANGRLELLTIRPEGYARRASESHIHVRTYPADKKHSQMYMCDGNDPAHMSTDITNNPEGRKAYHGLPKLPEEDFDTANAINCWNAKRGVSKKTMSVGRHQIKMTAY